MAQQQTLAVEGLKQFLSACDRAGKDTQREVRATFRKVGDIVKDDARTRFRPSDSRSAAGLRTIVRQRGVSVEQTRRKTTGRHPEWGGWQMRHSLLPALGARHREVEHAMEDAIDKVADHFTR